MKSGHQSCLQLRLALLAISVAICLASRAAAAEAESAAAKLSAATVTLRISSETSDKPTNAGAASPSDGGAAAGKPAPARTEEVVVCTAVSLGDGRIVTFHKATGAARFRVTLPSGEQSSAEPRVSDHHSGLMLLEIGDKRVPGLKLAEKLPDVGATVLTAAAAGIERPAVSQGILGATDRTLSGVNLPPLLQCDVRSSETGCGAGVVNAEGQLIGIVAATAAERGGWNYALPVEHVRRALAAWQAGKSVELERRRPVVGLTIGPGAKEGVVLIERIETSGPADRAGLMAGDQVIEADGRKIRSAYQAVSSIMKKQPGDTFSLTVLKDNQPRVYEITLEGGAVARPANSQPTISSSVAPKAVASSAEEAGAYRVGPQLRATARDGSLIEVRNGASVQEVAVDANPPRKAAIDEQDMLRIQVAAFAKVIEKLQVELQNRNVSQADQQKQIESLKREVERLEQQLQAK